MKRDWLTLAFGLGLVGAVVGLSLRHNIARGPAESPKPVESVPAPAAAAPLPASAPPSPSNDPDKRGAAVTPAVVRTKARAESPAAASAVPTTPDASSPIAALQVHSDVPGAAVFLDREFVGTTPLTLRGLTTGQKQLNVTATGHEGYSAAIDLTEGQNRINVEFMKVRLNANVPVVHRHGMGSCQGALTASPKGLSYDTPNTADAFTLTFVELDEFEVDYLKKNLRVRRRGGRTWNFTNDNGDALFAFHRDVNKARERLVANR